MRTFTFVALVILLNPMSGFGDDELSTHKSEVVAEIDQHINKLQEHKACVSSAGTKESLMECRKTMKAWREAERSEHMEKRKSRIEERMQKLQERKNKLNTP
jgi:ABC-type phosphate transport system auxiliary subunit